MCRLGARAVIVSLPENLRLNSVLGAATPSGNAGTLETASYQGETKEAESKEAAISQR